MFLLSSESAASQSQHVDLFPCRSDSDEKLRLRIERDAVYLDEKPGIDLIGQAGPLIGNKKFRGLSPSVFSAPIVHPAVYDIRHTGLRIIGKNQAVNREFLR